MGDGVRLGARASYAPFFVAAALSGAAAVMSWAIAEHRAAAAPAPSAA